MLFSEAYGKSKATLHSRLHLAYHSSGNRSFVENVKTLLGFRAKGSDVIELSEGYQLRKDAAHYKTLFEVENDDIGLENTYFRDVKAE